MQDAFSVLFACVVFFSLSHLFTKDSLVFSLQIYLRDMLNACSTLRTCHLNVPEGQSLTKSDLAYFHNFFKQGIFEQTRAYNTSWRYGYRRTAINQASRHVKQRETVSGVICGLKVYIYTMRLIGPISYLSACYIRTKVTKCICMKMTLHFRGKTVNSHSPGYEIGPINRSV